MKENAKNPFANSKDPDADFDLYLNKMFEKITTIDKDFTGDYKLGRRKIRFKDPHKSLAYSRLMGETDVFSSFSLGYANNMQRRAEYLTFGEGGLGTLESMQSMLINHANNKGFKDFANTMDGGHRSDIYNNFKNIVRPTVNYLDKMVQTLEGVGNVSATVLLLRSGARELTEAGLGNGLLSSVLGEGRLKQAYSFAKTYLDLVTQMSKKGKDFNRELLDQLGVHIRATEAGLTSVQSGTEGVNLNQKSMAVRATYMLREISSKMQLLSYSTMTNNGNAAKKIIGKINETIKGKIPNEQLKRTFESFGIGDAEFKYFAKHTKENNGWNMEIMKQSREGFAMYNKLSHFVNSLTNITSPTGSIDSTLSVGKDNVSYAVGKLLTQFMSTGLNALKSKQRVTGLTNPNSNHGSYGRFNTGLQNIKHSATSVKGLLSFNKVLISTIMSTFLYKVLTSTAKGDAEITEEFLAKTFKDSIYALEFAMPLYSSFFYATVNKGSAVTFPAFGAYNKLKRNFKKKRSFGDATVKTLFDASGLNVWYLQGVNKKIMEKWLGVR